VNKNTVFVYSGTGNSLASAKQVAARLDAEMIFVTAELAASGRVFGGEIGILIYPVYAFGMPMTVKRFIRGCGFDFQYFAVITICGSHSRGAFTEAIKLMKKRTQPVRYTNEIKSVENYVHMFALPPDDIIAAQTAAQIQNTDRIIGDLLARKRNRRFPFRPLSAFVRFVFRRATPAFARRYRITDACTGCGICRRVCPARAIKMEQQTISRETGDCITAARPVFDPRLCDHCQSCLQLCPHRAICFGKIGPDSRRYRNGGVEPDELFKRENNS
jgi:ferredoxin